MMSARRIGLLLEKEAKQFFRSRQPPLLFLVVLGSALLEILMSKSGVLGPTLWFSLYSAHVQLLPLALAALLAGVVSGEKEKGHWNFYSSKPFTPGEIVLAKGIFYNGVVIAATLLVWVVTVAVAQWVAGGGIPAWRSLFYLLVSIIVVTFMIISMEVAISALSWRTATAALSIVLCFFVLLMADGMFQTPTNAWRGFLAPYGFNTQQTAIVMRALEAVPSCPTCPPADYPSAGEVAKVCTYTFLEGLGFLLLGVVGARRRPLSIRKYWKGIPVQELRRFLRRNRELP